MRSQNLDPTVEISSGVFFVAIFLTKAKLIQGNYLSLICSYIK